MIFGYFKKIVKPYVLKLASRFVGDPNDLVDIVEDSGMVVENKKIPILAYQKEGLLPNRSFSIAGRTREQKRLLDDFHSAPKEVQENIRYALAPLFR